MQSCDLHLHIKVVSNVKDSHHKKFWTNLCFAACILIRKWGVPHAGRILFHVYSSSLILGVAYLYKSCIFLKLLTENGRQVTRMSCSIFRRFTHKCVI